MDSTGAPSGFLILDKPHGLTSRAAVDCAAQWFPRRTRLGHTGTLDPLATGVLVLAVGLGTRLTERVQEMPKSYRAGIRLGAWSDTDDGEGAITPVDSATAPERVALERALQGFVGTIAQVPPDYSAAKVAGRRAYALARRGAAVKLAPRSVRIDAIRIERYEYPHLDLEVDCGKGTYLRSLARDLGEQLGCGGYIQALRRTRIGPFPERAALPLGAKPDVVRQALWDLSWAADGLPRVVLSLLDADRFAHGRALPFPQATETGAVGVFDARDAFVGLGAIDDGRLRPKKVFYGVTAADGDLGAAEPLVP